MIHHIVKFMMVCIICIPSIGFAAITPPPTPAVPDPGIFVFWASSKKGSCQNTPSKGMLSSTHLLRSSKYFNDLFLWFGDNVIQALMEQTVALESSLSSASHTKQLNDKNLGSMQIKNQGDAKLLEKKLLSSTYQCPSGVGYAWSQAKTQQEIVNSMMAAEDRYIGDGWLIDDAAKERFFGSFDHAIQTNLKIFPESDTMSEKQLSIFNVWRNAMFPETQNLLPEHITGTKIEEARYLANKARIRETRSLLSEAFRRWGLSKAPMVEAEPILEWVGPYMSRPKFSVSIVEMPTVGTQVGVPQVKKIDSIKNKEPLYSKIVNYANNHGLDPDLVAAVVAQESGGNHQAQHPGSGAAGLMQLMAGTARELGLTVTDAVDERFDMDKNLDAGCRYLKQRINQFDGNIIAALASYNWGPGHVDCYLRYGHGMTRQQGKLRCIEERGNSLPPETYAYTAGIYGIPATAMRGDSQIQTGTHTVTEREIETYIDEMPTIQPGDYLSTDALYDLVGKRFTSENFLARIDALNEDAVMYELAQLKTWVHILTAEMKNDLALNTMLKSLSNFGSYIDEVEL